MTRKQNFITFVLIPDFDESVVDARCGEQDAVRRKREVMRRRRRVTLPHAYPSL